jgi:glucan phosphoethanolaminetransferase (alkaline phosphatase superfamily)
MNSDIAQALRRFGLDAVLWYMVPACFLTAYVAYFVQPSSAVGPHLLLVTVPFLLLQTWRLLLQRLTPAGRLQRSLVTVPATAFLGLVLTYYLLVLVGLESWGGVVNWNVIPTFFAQTAVLADALAIPPIVLPLGGIALLAALVGLCWIYFKHFDWTSTATAQIPGSRLAIITVTVAAFSALQVWQLAQAQWTTAGEPVSLTLHSQADVLDLEGYSVNPLRARHQDRLEDQARAAYRPVSGNKKNLVVIIVDALRPDHLSLYGYPRQTTPNLTRITSEQSAHVVMNVHATCADTICALFSLFSSKFTSEFSFRPFTLHEALRRNGYHIHLLLSGDHTYFHTLKGIYGQVDTFYDGSQAKGFFLNDDALLVDRLSRMPDWDHSPVMFQFHLMSSHILRKSDETPGKFQPARRYALRNSRDAGPGGDPTPTAVNFYDNGVLRADAIINDLLSLLQRKGYLENTLVVVTADHGESLGEHGLYTHANSVREEVLKVPLILIPYGFTAPAPLTDRHFPSQVDLAPTVLGELGLPVPATWTGHDLNSAADLPFTYFEEHAFAGLIDQRSAAHAWKYWVDRKSGLDHIFDLGLDPHENFDIRNAIDPALLAELRRLNTTRTANDLVLP